MPERIKLSRAKGWRMPPNTMKVDRSTKWGNPFRAGCVTLGRIAPDNASAVGLFRDMLNDAELRQEVGYPNDLSPLAGKNLACWCPYGQPCHADVLLELASNPKAKPTE